MVNSQMLLNGAPETAKLQDGLTSATTMALLNDEPTSFTNSVPPRYQLGP